MASWSDGRTRFVYRKHIFFKKKPFQYSRTELIRIRYFIRINSELKRKEKFGDLINKELYKNMYPYGRAMKAYCSGNKQTLVLHV